MKEQEWPHVPAVGSRDRRTAGRANCQPGSRFSEWLSQRNTAQWQSRTPDVFLWHVPPQPQHKHSVPHTARSHTQTPHTPRSHIDPTQTPHTPRSHTQTPYTPTQVKLRKAYIYFYPNQNRKAHVNKNHRTDTTLPISGVWSYALFSQLSDCKTLKERVPTLGYSLTCWALHSG